MSFTPIASLAFMSLLFAAPSLAQSSPAPISAASPASAGEVPEGFALAPDGTTLVHVASGLRFPATFKGFTRLKEQAFDPSGDYVAIAYGYPLSGKDSLVVRMAVVHIDEMSARDHYTIMRQAAMSHFSAATVLSEGPAVIPTNRSLDAYRGIFSGFRDGVPWRFSLTTANYGYWSGRLTAAYPDRDAAQAEKALDALLAEIRSQTPKAPKR